VSQCVYGCTLPISHRAINMQYSIPLRRKDGIGGLRVAAALRLGHPKQAVTQETILHSSGEMVSHLHPYKQECHPDSGFFNIALTAMRSPG
jgi:hypothetical protein